MPKLKKIKKINTKGKVVETDITIVEYSEDPEEHSDELTEKEKIMLDIDIRCQKEKGTMLIYFEEVERINKLPMGRDNKINMLNERLKESRILMIELLKKEWEL